MGENSDNRMLLYAAADEQAALDIHPRGRYLVDISTRAVAGSSGYRPGQILRYPRLKTEITQKLGSTPAQRFYLSGAKSESA